MKNEKSKLSIVIRDSIRLYFAPIVGAINAIRNEIATYDMAHARPKAKTKH